MPKQKIKSIDELRKLSKTDNDAREVRNELEKSMDADRARSRENEKYYKQSMKGVPEAHDFLAKQKKKKQAAKARRRTASPQFKELFRSIDSITASRRKREKDKEKMMQKKIDAHDDELRIQGDQSRDLMRLNKIRRRVRTG